MAFQGKSKQVQNQFPSPEELYLSGALTRTNEAVDGLWLHQGDIIRAYAEHHQATPDLALELPTGSGKTLPGLLIGDWVRRKGDGPVLYATPTKQLARQVHATAKREGVPSVLLIGSHRAWATIDESAVEGAEAIGITTYSAIFNSSPKVPEPRLLIFDDAHAGEQFVGEEYGLTIRRNRDADAYRHVLGALTPYLPGLLVQRLEGDPDPGAHHQVRLVLPAVDPAALAKLDGALARLAEPHKFQFAMIRAGLPACCIYLTYGAIQIRPMIPPTFENKVFSRAGQRLYLSATLGSGGELERAFGRAEVVRMPLPTKTPPRSGRRLFVFPNLTPHNEAVALTRRIVGLTNKALVLSQDTVAKAEAAAAALAGDGVPVMGRDDVEDGLDRFVHSPAGVLGLANRYDGLDLPGSACRIVVLDGKPDMVSLQEKFLSERAEASIALAERLRTRIVQGAGRCTRGPNDYAVVVVSGSDLTRYFSRSENREALEPELQAEVEFGWENSRGTDPAEVLENVEVFLEHASLWRELGEPKVAEFRQDAVKTPPPGAAALGTSAAFEVEAWQLAFRGDWIGASDRLQEAARLVGAGGESTRGYRALLLYIAAVWLHLGAEGETERARARELERQAGAASNRGGWLKEMRGFPGAEEVPLASADVVAVNAIVARIRGQLRPNRVSDELQEMRDAVAQSEPASYEQGLRLLGTYLGADASKPKGQGRCDSAWVWDTALWLTVEAKSAQHPDGLLPLHDIRQANTQLDQLAADRGMDHPPAGSPAIIVSDRLSVDPEHAPVANPNVFLTSTEAVQEIAADTAAVWRALLTSAIGGESGPRLRAHVQSVMTQHGCLPSQVVDRLTQYRIRPSE